MSVPEWWAAFDQWCESNVPDSMRRGFTESEIDELKRFEREYEEEKRRRAAH